MAVKRALTELEGAVLTEIGHRGNLTSFKVRRAFERSPSSSWSGSAGAVYPAIARLERAGMIDATAENSGRGTRTLSLTDAGREALETWFCDAQAACTIGTDPFRLRAGLWSTLPIASKIVVLEAMRQAVRTEMTKLEARGDLDPVEAIGNGLARAQQEMRLAWLDHELDAIGGKSRA